MKTQLYICCFLFVQLHNSLGILKYSASNKTDPDSLTLQPMCEKMILASSINYRTELGGTTKPSNIDVTKRKALMISKSLEEITGIKDQVHKNIVYDDNIIKFEDTERRYKYLKQIMNERQHANTEENADLKYNVVEFYLTHTGIDCTRIFSTISSELKSFKLQFLKYFDVTSNIFRNYIRKYFRKIMHIYNYMRKIAHMSSITQGMCSWLVVFKFTLSFWGTSAILQITSWLLKKLLKVWDLMY